MKFVRKLPNVDPVKHEELIRAQWHPLKEPKTFLGAFLLSIPFMVIAVCISFWIIKTFSGISLSEFGIHDDRIRFSIPISPFLWLLLLLVLHELLHLIFIPNFIQSKKTYVGINGFGAFVTTEEEITKRRFILVTVTPYLIISVLFPLLLGKFGLLTPAFKFFILLNAAASSIDLLTLFLIIFQVPTYVVLVNNRTRTYWKIK
ncbi:DUF3267 domain-containing protein [Ureibacillus sp. FSL K6-8385]|uniref:DUF3267 domain-containing protein n=1 Tax=Ureibacillus sp. FSL K6-8385 TaxID=2954684 RepID=UPI0031590ED1